MVELDPEGGTSHLPRHQEESSEPPRRPSAASSTACGSNSAAAEVSPASNQPAPATPRLSVNCESQSQLPFTCAAMALNGMCSCVSSGIMCSCVSSAFSCARDSQFASAPVACVLPGLNGACASRVASVLPASCFAPESAPVDSVQPSTRVSFVESNDCRYSRQRPTRGSSSCTASSSATAVLALVGAPAAKSRGGSTWGQPH